MSGGANNTPNSTWPERLQPSLYNDRLLPAETIKLRAEVRDFATREIAPLAHAIGHTQESREAFPFELFRKMGGEGLFRIPFKRDVGGSGLAYPATATAVVIEELAYFSNSVAAIYDVHCILAGHALEWATPELQQRYLVPLINGTKIGCFATTEPNASTELSVAAMRTEARLEGEEYVISGQKRWITNSPVASFVALLCKDGNRMSKIVVDLDAPGVTVGKPDRKLGNHGQLTADIYFDNVRVPAANRIAAPGDGLKVALQTLTYGRVGIAASGVGMAQSLFDQVAARLKWRHLFGKPLAAMQHWQFLMAERATEIENARNLYLKASLKLDEGVAFPEPEASMAKWYGTNLAASFARDAVQAFGGYGFMQELSADGSHYHVEEIYRDAKIAEIYEGANEIQKWIIARQIFGKEIVG